MVNVRFFLEGINMSEWKEYKLKDITYKITSGGTPKSAEASYYDGDIPWLNTKEINFNRIEKTERYITEDGLNNSSAKWIPKDSVIIAMYGTTAAKVAYSLIDLTTNQACCNLIINKDIADSKFVYYYIQSSYEDLFNLACGAAQQNLSVGVIADFPILLPPLDEQKRIASILSSLDDKIDLLHRENATLEAMAETLFKEYVLDKDNDATLEQIIFVQNGYAFKSKDFKEKGEHQIIKIKNISNGTIDIDTTDCVDSDVIVDVSTKFKINSGDILVAMTGAEIGKLGVIPKNDKSLWLNQRVGLLVEKYKGAKYLAYLQLKSEYGQDYIENTATGSAQPNISGIGIEKCGFPDLSEDERIQISQQIGEFYDKIIFNLGQINNIQDLKGNLLNKLMSNEIDIE